MKRLNDIIGSIATESCYVVASVIHSTSAFIVKYKWLFTLAAILLIAIECIIQIATYPTKP